MGLERKRKGKEERKTSREGRAEGRMQGIVCRLLDTVSQSSRVQKAQTITLIMSMVYLLKSFINSKRKT